MKTYPDHDYPIKTIVGQVFTISFESIPSAGYRWNVEYDSKIIDLVSNEYVPHSSFEPDSKKIKTVGGSGHEIFNFRAKQPGKTQIKAKYQRFEQIPLETKLFKVDIQ